MTFNVGAELNTDSFTQNFSTGTSNVNLRGLGLSSTLVLINGRRQTLSGAYADDGSTFVDTNTLMPMIMLGRVETVKDGASATYGTDAVAGVVNYITRKNFTGFEVQGRAQTTTSGPQNDFDFGAIWGSDLGDDAGNFVIAANFTKRTRLSASDRFDLTHRTGVSSAGQPGTIFIKDVVKHKVTGVTLPLIDPGCTGNPNSFKDVLSPASGAMPLDIGFCKFDFSSFYDMVPEETRLQTMATLTYDISDTVEMNLEAGYSRNKADRNVAPSFPMAEIVPAAVIDQRGATLPWIPQPLNAFISGYNAAQITAGNPAGMIKGVGLLHRPLGMIANKAITKNSAFRVAGGLKGNISDAWQWDFNATYSTSQFFLSITDAKRDAYTAALLTGKFNPFSTNMTTHKNSQAAIDAVIADVTVDGDTSLFTASGVVSGELAEFGDNMIMAAYGVQYRSSTMKYDWNDAYNAPSAANIGTIEPKKKFGGNLMFLYGGADFEGTQNVYSAFAELSVPLGDTLDLMLAGRYEDYGSGINSFDPKASLLWRPNDRFSARASFSTAFRAPSLFNTIGQQTSLSEIVIGNTRIFRPVTSYGNLDLKPEDSNIYNVGFTWKVVEDFTFGLDYWRFEFSNLITQESAQSVVDAALRGDPKALKKIEFGTFGDFRTIKRILTDIINAPTVTTDGLDINFGYKSEDNTGGSFHIAAESTYIFKYSATDQRGVKFEGAGNRNFKNFARSMPRLRGNINTGYSRDNYNANVYLRYIDSYHDDQNSAEISSYTTVDLQFGYLFGDSDTGKGLGVTVGVINVFDKEIPRVATNGGFDSKVHDPRQRMVYVSAKYSF
jgi:outer membrane receptor protein involved in Fe transport